MTIHKRLHGVVIGVAVALIFILVAGSLQAAPLTGTVKGKNGQIRKYLRVEIGGALTLTTYSNTNGQFTVDLPAGQYTITIVERNRQQAFRLTVPRGTEPVTETYHLKW